MTTDRDIPERWKNEHAVCGVGYRTVIEELGTAESLVRELARALQRATKILEAWADNDVVSDDTLMEMTDEVIPMCNTSLSHIPAHLRAPETTSTGESSTVLRQEDLRDV